MQFIAYVGLASFALALIPQTMGTVKAGRCDANASFIVMMLTGSLALMIYALLRGDTVFFAVNFLTTAGALVNFYFKFFLN